MKTSTAAVIAGARRGQGRLVFREGALVTAVRGGHWVVLDELNLAPSEVLEALNRRAPGPRARLCSHACAVLLPPQCQRGAVTACSCHASVDRPRLGVRRGR